MAAFTTTVQKLGTNGFYNSTSGGQIGFSTATSVVTLTCGALEDVVLWWHNPVASIDDVTCTISATTNTFYASRGRGDLVISTSLNSSNYGFIANLESAWFQSTANTVVFTFSTAIAVGAIEQSSTRQN